MTTAAASETNIYCDVLPLRLAVVSREGEIFVAEHVQIQHILSRSGVETLVVNASRELRTCVQSAHWTSNEHVVQRFSDKWAPLSEMPDDVRALVVEELPASARLLGPVKVSAAERKQKFA